MIKRDAVTGRITVQMTHDEFMTMYRRWQEKPETKALFAKIAAERKERVQRWVAEITAQKTK